jgi:hypothetical protein
MINEKLNSGACRHEYAYNVSVNSDQISQENCGQYFIMGLSVSMYSLGIKWVSAGTDTEPYKTVLQKAAVPYFTTTNFRHNFGSKSSA